MLSESKIIINQRWPYLACNHRAIGRTENGSQKEQTILNITILIFMSNNIFPKSPILLIPIISGNKDATKKISSLYQARKILTCQYPTQIIYFLWLLAFGILFLLPISSAKPRCRKSNVIWPNSLLPTSHPGYACMNQAPIRIAPPFFSGNIPYLGWTKGNTENHLCHMKCKLYFHMECRKVTSNETREHLVFLNIPHFLLWRLASPLDKSNS